MPSHNYNEPSSRLTPHQAAEHRADAERAETDGYVRLALQRCMAEVRLRGGNRYTPDHQNVYSGVLDALDNAIEDNVPPPVAEQIAGMKESGR